MSAERPLFIYHNNCVDGFGAALAAHLAHPDADFLPMTHGASFVDPELVTDRFVYLLDFSLPYQQMSDLATVAQRVVILDHHKTAIEELSGMLDDDLIGGILDPERSGATIAWSYFHDKKPVPRLFQYIEDRDLWRFDLKNSEAIHAALMCVDRDFPTWEELALSTRKTEKLVDMGQMIMTREASIAEEIAQMAKLRYFDTYLVPTVACPKSLASRVGNILCRNYPLSITYADFPGKRVVSLRSRKDTGVDVSELAKTRGGGGHKNAAGYTVYHDAE